MNQNSNRMNPLISVVVPTFERSQFVARALDSIYNQSWKNFEIILVDDNIPDSRWEAETKKILEPYCERGKLIYVKTSGAVGGGAARNLALQYCNGEYITFLDDDDRYLPDKLETQVKFMMKYKLDGSFQDVKWHNEEEKLVELRKMDYVTDYSKEGLLKAHILHSICPTSIYMFRRDKLMETEGFGEVPSGQDFILMLRCIESGMKMKYMPGVHVIQYIHKGKRISLGKNKVIGENNLYRLKHKYFHLLSKKEKNYVKFRHYAVLSFSSMRSGNMLQAAGYAIITVLSSPYDCCKEAIRYFRSKRGK